MARLLITGASGLLGANLAQLAVVEHEVVAVARQRRLRLDGVLSLTADLSERGAARELLERHRPDWVVHCAAATDLDRCERQPAWAQALNVEMPRHLAESCQALGIRLAHISTDSIFDGRKRGGYSEGDRPAPLNAYARSKWHGEQAVQHACPPALIVRTNFFGWTISPRHSLAEWFLNRLERGQKAPGFTDVRFSPLEVDHLAQALLELLDQGAQGLVHLPGATCLSKYDFGVQLAKAFGLDPALLQPVSIAESDLAVPRPRETCLNGARAESLLGRPMPGLDQGLQLLRGTRDQRWALRAAQPDVEELTHERD